jgi:hypothetical protein
VVAVLSRLAWQPSRKDANVPSLAQRANVVEEAQVNDVRMERHVPDALLGLQGAPFARFVVVIVDGDMQMRVQVRFWPKFVASRIKKAEMISCDSRYARAGSPHRGGVNEHL